MSTSTSNAMDQLHQDLKLPPTAQHLNPAITTTTKEPTTQIRPSQNPSSHPQRGLRGDTLRMNRRSLGGAQVSSQEGRQLDLIKATIENRQLIGYRIGSMPDIVWQSKEFDGEVSVKGKRSVKNQSRSRKKNKDTQYVNQEQPCEICNGLVEQRKQLIWNQQAHGRPCDITQKRQLMDSLLQNKPTCPDCRRKRINQLRGEAKFRTGGFLNASSPYHRKKQLRIKQYLQQMYKNGSTAASVGSSVNVNEQGSQTDVPGHPRTSQNPESTHQSLQSRTGQRSSPTNHEHTQHQMNFVIESGAKTQSERLDLNDDSTMMQVGGMEDINGLYHDRASAGVKSIDIDIGDNGADSTYKIETLHAAVRRLPGVQTNTQSQNQVEKQSLESNYNSISPDVKFKSSDYNPPASSAFSIPVQPGEGNSSLQIDESQSMSSPLRNEQIYSRIHQIQKIGSDVTKKEVQDHKSPQNKQISPKNDQIGRRSQSLDQKMLMEISEPVSSSQPIFSTFKMEPVNPQLSTQKQQELQLNQILVQQNEKNGPDHTTLVDTANLQIKVASGVSEQCKTPNQGGSSVEHSVAPSVSSKVAEVQGGTTLTKFSSVKPQITNYGKFIQQKINTELNLANLSASSDANQNILVGQRDLLELQILQRQLTSVTPHIQTKFNSIPISSTQEQKYTLNFDNQQLRAFLQQQVSQQQQDENGQMTLNQIGLNKLNTNQINQQPSDSHNSSANGIIIEYRDDNSSILKMFGNTLNLPPGNLPLGSRTQINSHLQSNLISKSYPVTQAPHDQCGAHLNANLVPQATTNKHGISKLNLSLLNHVNIPSHNKIYQNNNNAKSLTSTLSNNAPIPVNPQNNEGVQNNSRDNTKEIVAPSHPEAVPIDDTDVYTSPFSQPLLQSRMPAASCFPPLLYRRPNPSPGHVQQNPLNSPTISDIQNLLLKNGSKQIQNLAGQIDLRGEVSRRLSGAPRAADAGTQGESYLSRDFFDGQLQIFGGQDLTRRDQFRQMIGDDGSVEASNWGQGNDRYWSVDHFLTQKYKSSVVSDRREKVQKRRRDQKNKKSYKGTKGGQGIKDVMVEHSDRKVVDVQNREKSNVFVIPNSRMSERYGVSKQDSSENKGVEPINSMLQSVDNTKKTPGELTLVQISKVRVFKAKDYKLDNFAQAVESPTIRKSLSIDKGTEVAGYMTNSQYQKSDINQSDEHDDNQAPLSTKRKEEKLNQSNKTKTIVTQIDGDFDDNLSSNYPTEDKQRRILNITTMVEKETQGGDMKSQGTDFCMEGSDISLGLTHQEILKMMKSQEKQMAESQKKVILKTMQFGGDDYKADKRQGINQDIYKLAISSQLSKKPINNQIGVPINMSQTLQQSIFKKSGQKNKRMIITTNSSNQRNSSAMKNISRNSEFDLTNQYHSQQNGITGRWSTSLDKEAGISGRSRIPTDYQDHCLQGQSYLYDPDHLLLTRNSFETKRVNEEDRIYENSKKIARMEEIIMKQQTQIMPGYRTLQIQEGKFDPEELEALKNNEKQTKYDKNSKLVVDQLRDFKIDNFSRQKNTRNAMLSTQQSQNSKGGKPTRKDTKQFNNSAHINRELDTQLTQTQVDKFHGNAFNIQIKRPSLFNQNTRPIDQSSQSIEPIVNSYRITGSNIPSLNRSLQPEPDHYPQTNPNSLSAFPGPIIPNQNHQVLKSVRLQQSLLKPHLPFQSTEYQSWQQSTENVGGSQSRVQGQGLSSKRMHYYKKSVQLRKDLDIRDNLEESLRTFRKSQRVRKFIDESNGPLEHREGNLAYPKKELPTTVGQNARVKKLLNMDFGASLTRRGSCFTMQTHQLDQNTTIEKVRRSIDEHQTINTIASNRKSTVKNQGTFMMGGDQDSPIINLAFEIQQKQTHRNKFNRTTLGMEPSGQNNDLKQCLPQNKPLGLKMTINQQMKSKRSEQIAGITNQVVDYSAARQRYIGSTNPASKKDIGLVFTKKSTGGHNSTESTKQNQNSDVFGDQNQPTNRQSESLQSINMSSTKNATVGYKLNDFFANNPAKNQNNSNEQQNKPKTIFSQMHVPVQQSQNRQKKDHNKDLHLEVPENSHPKIIQNVELQQEKQASSVEPSQQVDGYSIESKSVMEEKLEKDVEDQTIDITPTRNYDNVMNSINNPMMSTTMYIAAVDQPVKGKDNTNGFADIQMHKLKLPTIKVDGTRPRYSRDMKRASIDEKYFKQSFSLLNQKPNFRLIKPQRNSLIEFTSAFDNTSLQGWQEKTESNGSLFMASKTAKTKFSSTTKQQAIAEKVEVIVKKSIDNGFKKGYNPNFQNFQPKFVKSFAQKQQGNFLYKMYQDYSRTLETPNVAVTSAKIQVTTTSKQFHKQKTVIVKNDQNAN